MTEGEEGVHRDGVIRLGLIGTGLAVEQLHWPALRLMPDRFRVTAFADASRSQAERFASYSGTPMALFTPDWHDVLARTDVDAVLITLPIPFLYEAARASLAADRHVLCEKPTGTDEAQAREFLKLPDEFPDRVILIGENFFYRDDVRLARSLLDAGELGRVHMMAWRVAGRLIPREGSFTGTPWRHHPEYRGGVQLDAGVHNIAQIRMLCGDAVSVHALARQENRTMDAPSDLVVNLEFAAGSIGTYAACYSEIPVGPEANDMRVYGTEGVLTLNGNREERVVTLRRPDGTVATHCFRGIDNGYHAELRNFHDAVVHGEPVVGTILESFKNLLIVVRALDSADAGAVVRLDDVPGGARPEGPALWRPRGAEGLFEGLPGEHVASGNGVVV